MRDPLQAAMRTSASAMSGQAVRLRVASENLANADTTPSAAGETPYRRKTISFRSEFDRVAQASVLRVRRVAEDPSPFPVEHNPQHPAADGQGFVQRPNVNTMIELADIKDANGGYQAALQAFRQSRDMVMETIGLLRS